VFFKKLDFDPDPEMDPELPEKSDPDPDPDQEIIFSETTHCSKVNLVVPQVYRDFFVSIGSEYCLSCKCCIFIYIFILGFLRFESFRILPNMKISFKYW